MNAEAGVWLKRSALGFLIGTLLFSGSLYMLAFIKLGHLGKITPVGGVFLLFGWGALAMAFIKKK
jgi:uncharacterized membrane protein YgdD (TMEM256/DUF423 family)